MTYLETLQNQNTRLISEIEEVNQLLALDVDDARAKVRLIRLKKLLEENQVELSQFYNKNSSSLDNVEQIVQSKPKTTVQAVYQNPILKNNPKDAEIQNKPSSQNTDSNMNKTKIILGIIAAISLCIVVYIMKADKVDVNKNGVTISKNQNTEIKTPSNGTVTVQGSLNFIGQYKPLPNSILVLVKDESVKGQPLLTGNRFELKEVPVKTDSLISIEVFLVDNNERLFTESVSLAKPNNRNVSNLGGFNLVATPKNASNSKESSRQRDFTFNIHMNQNNNSLQKSNN